MENSYPWYDSNWLTDYVRVKAFIKQHYPKKYAEFIKIFEPLKNRHDFDVVKLNNIFDDTTLQNARNLIQDLKYQEKKSTKPFYLVV